MSELLLANAPTLQPLPAGEWTVAPPGGRPGLRAELTTELQQEQLEVICPPQTALVGQLATSHADRAMAEAAVTRVDRVVALPTAPVW